MSEAQTKNLFLIHWRFYFYLTTRLNRCGFLLCAFCLVSGSLICMDFAVAVLRSQTESSPGTQSFTTFVLFSNILLR